VRFRSIALLLCLLSSLNAFATPRHRHSHRSSFRSYRLTLFSITKTDLQNTLDRPGRKFSLDGLMALALVGLLVERS
jgi:hypothetical protein